MRLQNSAHTRSALSFGAPGCNPKVVAEAGGVVEQCVGGKRFSEGASAIVQYLQNHESVEGCQILDAVPAADAGMLFSLVSLGVIKATSGEFGQDCFSLDKTKCSIGSIKRCTNPQLMVEAPVIDTRASESKLELLIVLWRAGFMIEDKADQQLRPAEPKVLVKKMLFKSLWYFRALAELDRLFEKDLPFLYQCFLDSYYRFILEGGNVAAVHGRQDLMLLREPHFRALCAGREVPHVLSPTSSVLPPPIEDLADDSEAASAGDQLALDDCPISGTLDLVDIPDPSPWRIELGGQAACFDGYSHSTKKQRVYTHCRWKSAHGDRCFKYRQTVQFANPKAAAAWLLAWEGAGEHLATKAEHAAFEPSSEAVAAILSQM